MRAKAGGCMFLMERGQNCCSRGLMVIFQSAVNLSQPTDLWSESLGCSRKEETFTISLGKVGETERKVAKKMIRVWRCKDRSRLMWNSCRGGLTSCVQTHQTHTRDGGSRSTLRVVFLKLFLKQNSPSSVSCCSLSWWERALCIAHRATNLNNEQIIEREPSSLCLRFVYFCYF